MRKRSWLGVMLALAIVALHLLVVLVLGFFAIGIAGADEVPITGAVMAVDVANNTFMVKSVAKGKTREVTIHVRPDTKIVRFTRAPDGKGGFAEQPATLADIKPGWMVSVTTHHEGDKEVAHLVRVVHER